MNLGLIAKIKAAIFSNPYTTFLALVGVVVLAIYSKVMTPAQILTLVISILTGLGASDGSKDAQ